MSSEILKYTTGSLDLNPIPLKKTLVFMVTYTWSTVQFYLAVSPHTEDLFPNKIKISISLCLLLQENIPGYFTT